MAKETNAVERYLLDEFTPDERADFEEHMFDCTICGEQVRQGAIAIENTKEVFREEGKISEASRLRSRNQRWGAWFRVPALVPSMAALALAAVVAYQNWLYIPALERPRVLSNAVIAPMARERAPVVVTDPRLPMFNVTFEVDAPQPYPAYVCDFRRSGGAEVSKLGCGTSKVAAFERDVLLPKKDFPAGEYVMILRPAAEPETEIQRYSFVIQDGGQTE